MKTPCAFIFCSFVVKKIHKNCLTLSGKLLAVVEFKLIFYINVVVCFQNSIYTKSQQHKKKLKIRKQILESKCESKNIGKRKKPSLHFLLTSQSPLCIFFFDVNLNRASFSEKSAREILILRFSNRKCVQNRKNKNERKIYEF